jgi:hypothetical protein
MYKKITKIKFYLAYDNALVAERSADLDFTPLKQGSTVPSYPFEMYCMIF